MLRHRNDSVETALVNHCDIFPFSSPFYLCFFLLALNFRPEKENFSEHRKQQWDEWRKIELAQAKWK